MSANNALHIAVLAGDGIGPEVMAPALEILRRIEARSSLEFRFTEAPAGANHYRETGKSMPESTVRLCEEADAILLGACGLPSVRYPDNTEIAPQIELRFLFDLYAGVRPARLIPILPLAPGMFSMQNCLPRCSDNFAAIRRAATSVGPAGAYGTITRTGRTG